MEMNPESPPKALSERVLSHVRKDMNVNSAFVIFKLFWIHFFAAGLTLSFCPQFNVGIERETVNNALYHLMEIHPLLCAAFCGSIFLGATALASVLVLRPAELICLKQKSVWIYSLLLALSLGFFMFTGSLFTQHYDWSFIATWCLAAILISWFITRLGTYFRIHLIPSY